MARRKIIDISTKEKKEEVFRLFATFTSKNQAHIYFGISDNKAGSEYLKEIAECVGFNLETYKSKKIVKYCKQCGKQIKSKWAKEFCCSSCAAKFNNTHRNHSVYEEISRKLSKPRKNNGLKNDTEKQKKQNEKEYNKICGYCGKEFKTRRSDALYCCHECSVKDFHKRCYQDFIDNPEKYCRGNYTPKSFKKDFLSEQGGVCAICGCEPQHNGKPLVFVLDHIDGNASNNKRENLRMICPNCDSQLDTFKSKNKNSARRNYWREHIINEITSKQTGA